jgi:hypothetical protein
LLHVVHILFMSDVLRCVTHVILKIKFYVPEACLRRDIHVISVIIHAMLHVCGKHLSCRQSFFGAEIFTERSKVIILIWMVIVKFKYESGSLMNDRTVHNKKITQLRKESSSEDIVPHTCVSTCYISNKLDVFVFNILDIRT